MVALLLWVWGVQQPIPGEVWLRWVRHGATLGAALGMVLGAWWTGRYLERWMGWPSMPLWSRELYRWGFGNLLWAWLGLGLSVVGWARSGLVAFLGLAGWLAALGWTWRLWRARDLPRGLSLPVLPGIGWALAALLGMLALLPPTSFDALMYHLALPQRILRAGQLPLLPVAHFWNPALAEYLFLWPLAWGLDSTPKVFHGLWALGTLLWVAVWSQEMFGPQIPKYTWLVAFSVPSLPVLASWAYTDFTLTFYTLASLYALARYLRTQDRRWLPLAGGATGLALSVKYTALGLGIAGVLALMLLSPGPWLRRLRELLLWTGWTLATAWPWYLRNWVYMGNPLYPFFFGGRGWDDFLARHHGQGGTGLGLDLWAWVRFPWEVVAGIGDLSYVDGRMGPWWLILFPLVVTWVYRRWRGGLLIPEERLLILWGMVGGGLWLVGVAWSQLLRQVRLLYPVLFGLLPLWGYALHRLDALAPRPSGLQLQRLTLVLLYVSAGVVLVEHALDLVDQQGLAYLVGRASREDFYEARLPLYQEYLALLEQVPNQARVLALYEPRSYAASREVFPDTLLLLWPHALYRYGAPEEIVRAWQAQGFTHLVVFWYGARLLYQENLEVYTPEQWQALQRLTSTLPLVARSPSQAYALYQLSGGER